VVYLDDWKHEGRKTVWYNSRFYRLNILWENNTFFIRDLHRFNENLVSVTHSAPLTNTFLEYGTLPVMDGARWSDKEKAGIWPVLLASDGATSPMTPEGTPTVKELNSTDLSITQPLQGGGHFSMVCCESNITCSAVDGQGHPLRWAWNGVGGAQQKTAVQKAAPNAISYHWTGMDYQLRLAPNGCSDPSGKLVLILGGF
jgi:hypothetical protein